MTRLHAAIFSYCVSCSWGKELPTTTALKRFAKLHQIQNATKLIARMDHGHWLIDRFLTSIPMVLCPTLQQQCDANTDIATEPIDALEQIFQAIHHHHERHLTTRYTFNNDAQGLPQQMNEHFTEEVNIVILDGNMPPKSKKSDNLPRIALALHVLSYATQMLLLGQTIDECPTVISSKTLERTNTFVMHLKQQKDAVCQVSLQYKTY